MSYLKEKQIRDGNNFLTDVISVRATCFWRSLLVLSLSVSQFSFPPLHRPWGSSGFVGGEEAGGSKPERGSPGKAAAAPQRLVEGQPILLSQDANPTSLPGATRPPAAPLPWPYLFPIPDAVPSRRPLAG